MDENKKDTSSFFSKENNIYQHIAPDPAISEQKRSEELIIANKELVFQNEEKEKRASELLIANEELAHQNREKEKRASELVIANKELIFQNEEKEKRAAELVIADIELAFQNEEKERRASELVIANEELLFQNQEKEKRASELIIANIELAYQNGEKEKRAAELIVANKELAFQNKEKEKRATELSVANRELVFQNKEKEKRANELIIANLELSFQNQEKENRASELVIANDELLYQNREKENRAAELAVANEELLYQNDEKEKRAAELKRANRLYTFISEINQNIVREKDELGLFRNSCNIAHDFGKFKIAWIGLFKGDYDEISQIAQTGIPKEAVTQFENVPLQPGGPQSQVLLTGKYFICNDIANDAELESWSALAAKQQINSCIILPIKKSAEIIGTFNLYAAELNFFNKEEIDLLLEVTGDISFALDTFEREKVLRRTQEIVIENEKRFHALIEKSADMITLGNREGKLIYGSPSITAVLGYSPQELINMSLFDVVHPDDIAELLQSRNELLKNPGEAFNFQHRRKHKSGNWIWCEGTFTNLLDEPGINAIVTNFRDVSEKKRADKQQEFDRNNLDALINNTNDLMWSVDMDFNLITSNQPFSDILKLTAGRAVAKGDNVLDATYSPQQAEPYKKLYQRAFTGESFTEVIYNELPVDSWSEISYCPIRKGDEVIGAACHSRDITAKINAERRVIVNEKRFRALVENSTDAVAIFSADGKPTYVSPSTRRVLGYREEEAKELTIFSITHPDDLAGLEQTWKQMLAGYGISFPDVIRRVRHKNGAWRWLEGTFTNLLQDTSVNGVVNNFRDITEKKLAEEALLLTQFAIESAGDAVFWMTPDARIVKVNEAACLMLGYSRQEMTMLAIPDIDPYFSTEKWLDHYEELRQKGTLFFETIQQTKDGRLIPVEIRANYIKFGDAEFNCAFSRDISERKLAEENLLQSESRLKEAQDIARIGNFQIDMSNYSEQWSDQLYNILGVEKTGINPTEPFSNYIHPDDLAAATDAFNAQLDSSMDYRLVRKDGVLRYVNSEWKFEFDDSGKAVRVYGVMQDITERKQGEIDRKNLVNDLLLRNSELEQFAYVASHDLQEPLRMITSFMTQLKKKYSAVIDDKGRKYIHFAVDGAKRMRQIILDLLEFSRVGKTEDELEEVDFNMLINEILALYRRQIEEAKAHVIFKNLPAIKTYKTPLRQVFQNLIGNSLKYHEAGTAPMISIGCTETKTYFQFSVSDNGIGIAPEYAEKIFIIFQRLHNRDEYSGTGMGLAIVKKIVEGLGGKIWVESTEGNGATFYFTIMKTPNR